MEYLQHKWLPIFNFIFKQNFIRKSSLHHNFPETFSNCNLLNKYFTLLRKYLSQNLQLSKNKYICCIFEVYEARTREYDDYYLSLFKDFQSRTPKPAKSAIKNFPKEYAMNVVASRLMELPFSNKIPSIMHILKDVPKDICNIFLGTSLRCA